MFSCEPPQAPRLRTAKTVFHCIEVHLTHLFIYLYSSAIAQGAAGIWMLTVSSLKWPEIARNKICGKAKKYRGVGVRFFFRYLNGNGSVSGEFDVAGRIVGA